MESSGCRVDEGLGFRLWGCPEFTPQLDALFSATGEDSQPLGPCPYRWNLRDHMNSARPIWQKPFEVGCVTTIYDTVPLQLWGV